MELLSKLMKCPRRRITRTTRTTTQAIARSLAVGHNTKRMLLQRSQEILRIRAKETITRLTTFIKA
jgi:hypothetical protein